MARAPSHETIEAVFEALRAVAPTCLQELRDGDGDVESWAERHHLNSPCLIDRARILRDWWLNCLRHQRLATDANRLTIDGLVVVKVNTRGDHEWVRNKIGAGRDADERDWIVAENLPQPARETQRQWLARAANMYRERSALSPRRSRPRRREDSYYQWLVEILVLERRPTVIANAHNVDRASVERETKKLAALLGLTRRRWRQPGRPRK